jgi:prolyl-tRNA editing enzyme YbaK/EbsC (Cys-tRNA(Pro) deacylase)
MTTDPDPTAPLPRAVQRVADALAAAGATAEIRLVDGSAHTAGEAAEALGVEVGQIVKSMVFRGAAGDRLVLVLVSGERRVDLARVAAELGEAVERADPGWVRERTGFAIGGVPPLGHLSEPTVLIDRRLPAEAVLWAGAGTPRAMFSIGGAELVALTGGVVADVAIAEPS